MKRGGLRLPRERTGGKPGGESGEPEGLERLLLCEVGPERFAIPVGFLREVVLPETMGAGAEPPDRESNPLAYRGASIPGVNLATLFGYAGCGRTGESRVLVGEGGGRRFGLVVDRVGDVVEASPRSFLPVPDGASALPAACFGGVWPRGDGLALVLNPAGLAALECVERAEVGMAPGSPVVAGVP